MSHGLEGAQCEYNINNEAMKKNDLITRYVRMTHRKCQIGNKGRCKKRTRGEMRMMNQKQNEAKNTKRSDEPLKSNMKWSHISNECNDGRDNDPEYLRGHSSHFQNTWQSEYKEKEDLKKLTYELSTTNILDKITLRYQYTHSMMENAMHIHTWAYFSFPFIFFSFFPYIYTNAHTLNMKKKIYPKDDINNG